MPSTAKLIRAGVLALGVSALAMPALAQTTGNPANPTGSETPNNIPPKGNIGTSGSTGGVGQPGMAPGAPMGTTGAGGADRLGDSQRPSAMPPTSSGVPAENLGARGANAPSNVPNPGPKGNIGGN